MLLEPIAKLPAAGRHVGKRRLHLVVEAVGVHVAFLVRRHVDPPAIIMRLFAPAAAV